MLEEQLAAWNSAFLAVSAVSGLGIPRGNSSGPRRLRPGRCWAGQGANAGSPLGRFGKNLLCFRQKRYFCQNILTGVA